MAKENLAPDDFELRVCMYSGIIPKCPFCGRNPFLRSSVNHNTMVGKVIYQASITCDYRCMASMIFNAETREQAQAGVIEKWSRRVPCEATALNK